MQKLTSREAFDSRDPTVTTAFQCSLLSRGILGQLAFGVFRAQKRSTVAKRQRRGKYRRGAYDGKSEALKYLDSLLQKNPELGLSWGWGNDESQSFHSAVLYIDLPTGQCSFHSESSHSTVVYPGKWDERSSTRDSILAFCDEALLSPEVVMVDNDLMPFGSRVGDRLRDLDASYVQWLLNWEGLSNWSVVGEALISITAVESASRGEF